MKPTRTGKPGSLAVCLYTYLRAERMALPSWNAGVRMVSDTFGRSYAFYKIKGRPTKEVWTLHQSTNLAVLSQGPSGDTQVLNLYAISYFSWMELNKRQDSQSSQGNGILSTLDSSWTLKVYALLCIIWGLFKSVAPLETLCCFTWIACHNAGRLQGILNQSYYS